VRERQPRQRSGRVRSGQSHRTNWSALKIKDKNSMDDSLYKDIDDKNKGSVEDVLTVLILNFNSSNVEL
jgi:hypothetical protein